MQMNRDESSGAPTPLGAGVDALAELSDADLERVVGGLQRAWVVGTPEGERVDQPARVSVPAIVDKPAYLPEPIIVQRTEAQVLA
jgi:hypothetical protein